MVMSAEWSPKVSRVMRSAALELSIHPDRERVVVVVAGEIDLATVDELDAAVRELLAGGWSNVVLDLRPVEFLDSTGLGWLVAIERDARAHHWRLALVDGSPPVARLLDLTGLRGHFRWTAGL
jgi:anti-sigma B factor antagonist